MHNNHPPKCRPRGRHSDPTLVALAIVCDGDEEFAADRPAVDGQVDGLAVECPLDGAPIRMPDARGCPRAGIQNFPSFAPTPRRCSFENMAGSTGDDAIARGWAPLGCVSTDQE